MMKLHGEYKVSLSTLGGFIDPRHPAIATPSQQVRGLYREEMLIIFPGRGNIFHCSFFSPKAGLARLALVQNRTSSVELDVKLVPISLYLQPVFSTDRTVMSKI